MGSSFLFFICLLCFWFLLVRIYIFVIVKIFLVVGICKKLVNLKGS